jgi:hypothetical protein
MNRGTEMTTRCCPCGSGHPRSELFDARGIFYCFVCEACETKASKRPPAVGANYWLDDAVPLSLALPEHIVDTLAAHGRSKKLTANALAAILLQRIAEDDLVKAVIDD